MSRRRKKRLQQAKQRYQREPRDLPEVKPPQNILGALPPNRGKPIIEHVSTFATRLQQWFSRLYENPDEAYRGSDDHGSRMRHDPVIMEPLRQRQLATALLNWQITPEDDNDPVQKTVCERLTAIVKNTPSFLKLKMALLEAVWFGRYAVNPVYQWDAHRLTEMNVAKWVPIHGDKLRFEHVTGNVGVMTYMITGVDTGAHELRISDESRVMMLTGMDRESLIVHKHEIEDGEFYEAHTGGFIHGVGLRTRVYWPFYLKQKLLQWLLDFAERTGLGVQIWYYEQGNPESEEQVREAAEKYSNEHVVLFPRPIGSEQQGPGMERQEAGTGGATFFQELLDGYFGAQIKRMIAGQNLTSESDATGLGSGLAEAHQDTFQQIVKYDSQNLEETLTNDYLWVLAKWNFPGIDWKPRFEIVVEDNDPEALLNAAKTFQEMGGDLGEDQVREIVGLAAPDESDRILKPMGGNEPFGQQPPQVGDQVDLPDGEYDMEELLAAQGAA